MCPAFSSGMHSTLQAGTGCTVILCEAGAACGVDIRGGAPEPGKPTACARQRPPRAKRLLPLRRAARSALTVHGGHALPRGERNRVRRRRRAGAHRLGGSDIRSQRGRRSTCARMRQWERRRASTPAIEVRQGNVGAGTGATIGGARDAARQMKCGLGTASVRVGRARRRGHRRSELHRRCRRTPDTGEVLAGTLNADRGGFAGSPAAADGESAGYQDFYATHSTIGVVATNAQPRQGPGEPRRDDGP